MPTPVDVLNNQLRTYAHNAAAPAIRTCPLCRTELPIGSAHCRSCQRLLLIPGAIPDTTGFGIYAVGGQQTGYMMRRYKNGTHNRDYGLVRALLAQMLQHNDCLARISGSPLQAITYIPSLSHRSHRYHALAHILGDIVRSSLGLSRLTRLHLTPTRAATLQRSVDSHALAVQEGQGQWGHTLIIDDTWTTGSSVGSATLALRRSGVRRVSSLVVARWINADYSAALTTELGRTDSFDARTCPWTLEGQCPPPGAPEPQATGGAS